VAPEIFIWGLT